MPIERQHDEAPPARGDRWARCHTTQGGAFAGGLVETCVPGRYGTQARAATPQASMSQLRFKVLASPLGPMRWIEPGESRSWFPGRPTDPANGSAERQLLRTRSRTTRNSLAAQAVCRRHPATMENPPSSRSHRRDSLHECHSSSLRPIPSRSRLCRGVRTDWTGTTLRELCS